jgi:hypothetical protein
VTTWLVIEVPASFEFPWDTSTCDTDSEGRSSQSGILGYFETTAVDCPWVIKRTNKRRLADRGICCMHVDTANPSVGQPPLVSPLDNPWTINGCSLEVPQNPLTTSNMKTHLAKHGIYCPTSSTQPAEMGPDIRSFMRNGGSIPGMSWNIC